MIASPEGVLDRHIRAARMLAYTLTQGDVSGWLGAARVWAVRLSVGERLALASAALGALSEDHAAEVAERFLRPFHGPLPPFLDLMDEARDWAGWATSNERKAAIAACWEEMDESDRAAFLEWAQAQGKVAA